MLIRMRERELKLIGVNFLASKEKINGTLNKLRINTLWKHSLIWLFLFIPFFLINTLLCGENGDISVVQKAYLKGKWVIFVLNSNYENNHKQVTKQVIQDLIN